MRKTIEDIIYFDVPSIRNIFWPKIQDNLTAGLQQSTWAALITPIAISMSQVQSTIYTFLNTGRYEN